jgi:hypothetical protein
MSFRKLIFAIVLNFFRLIGLLFLLAAFAQFQDNFIGYGFVSVVISFSILFITFWLIPRRGNRQQGRFDSVKYIRDCLINHPPFPGTVDTLTYIEDLRWQHIENSKTAEQISEAVGEIWGRCLVKVLIANSILGSVAIRGNRSEIRAVAREREKLVLQQENITGHTKLYFSVLLDTKIVANSAAKYSDFIISATDFGNTLWFESHVKDEIKQIRREAMHQFTNDLLIRQLDEGILSMTGERIFRNDTREE